MTSKVEINRLVSFSCSENKQTHRQTPPSLPISTNLNQSHLISSSSVRISYQKMAMSNQNQRQERINRNEDFAYSILWSPLPMISWVLPFIGHLAIADSTGVASDFQGPYFVGDKGFLAFGRATRVLTLDVSDLSRKLYSSSRH